MTTALTQPRNMTTWQVLPVENVRKCRIDLTMFLLSDKSSEIGGDGPDVGEARAALAAADHAPDRTHRWRADDDLRHSLEPVANLVDVLLSPSRATSRVMICIRGDRGRHPVARVSGSRRSGMTAGAWLCFDRPCSHPYPIQSGGFLAHAWGTRPLPLFRPGNWRAARATSCLAAGCSCPRRSSRLGDF